MRPSSTSSSCPQAGFVVLLPSTSGARRRCRFPVHKRSQSCVYRLQSIQDASVIDVVLSFPSWSRRPPPVHKLRPSSMPSACPQAVPKLRLPSTGRPRCVRRRRRPPSPSWPRRRPPVDKLRQPSTSPSRSQAVPNLRLQPFVARSCIRRRRRPPVYPKPFPSCVYCVQAVQDASIFDIDLPSPSWFRRPRPVHKVRPSSTCLPVHKLFPHCVYRRQRFH